ncbi:hypothetical protein KC19_3G216300 [Ceratodon purpureus]|uniref:Cyanovirin-N domain-containing protein n=1 Tax=Ceratodon purpureus TaxID=3225 RepID=A0A8T0INX0_CERPU|nr:hypothetical protein KC19_3G216300 [Ceratodon purpureus]
MAHQSSAHAAYTAATVLCTFALLFSFAKADCGGFALTCDGISVSAQGGLSCICGNGQGGFNRASLNLNSYIGNTNGNLVDGAGFASSCSNIRWYQLGTANQGVAAECKKIDGSVGSTTLYNVQRRVVNSSGNLVFNNCRRRSLLEAVDAGAVAGRKMLSM